MKIILKHIFVYTMVVVFLMATIGVSVYNYHCNCTSTDYSSFLIEKNCNAPDNKPAENKTCCSEHKTAHQHSADKKCCSKTIQFFKIKNEFNTVSFNYEKIVAITVFNLIEQDIFEVSSEYFHNKFLLPPNITPPLTGKKLVFFLQQLRIPSSNSEICLVS